MRSAVNCWRCLMAGAAHGCSNGVSASYVNQQVLPGRRVRLCYAFTRLVRDSRTMAVTTSMKYSMPSARYFTSVTTGCWR